MAGEGEDDRLRYTKFDNPSGYDRTITCTHCKRKVRIPKEGHVLTVLATGCVPLFPSLLKNRTARGQFSDRPIIDFTSKTKKPRTRRVKK